MPAIAGWSTGSPLVVGQQILLADIGDVARFRILGEQMVERLVLGRPDLLGDRLIPFLAVGEDRIDVEDHAAEVEQPVAHHLADREAGMGDRRRRGGRCVGVGHDCRGRGHALLCRAVRARRQASRRRAGHAWQAPMPWARARRSSTGPRLTRGLPCALAERCRSGRSGRSRKPLCPQGYRGFESLPLRQPALLTIGDSFIFSKPSRRSPPFHQQGAWGEFRDQ